MAARSKVAGVFTQSLLSRKKGRQYGAGHQKALQISVWRLPLVDVHRREGATFLPGFRTKRNAWQLYMNAIAAFWLGERSASHRKVVQEGMWMVYLVTKRLKCPLERSSSERGSLVGGAIVAFL